MSNPTRTGKIARLPKAVREEINRRLDNGATAHSLLDWLNALPEVQAVVQSEFDGHPVSDQNLSQWRKGGYEDWLRHQEALEVVKILHEQAQELKAQSKDRLPVNEVLSLWLSSRFVAATREIPTLEPEAAWKKQRQLCDDLMKLRRAEHRTEHLQLERDRVELHRQEVQIDLERLEMDRTENKRRSGGKTAPKSGINNESGAAAEPQPDQRWADISDEEKIAWARRPDNYQRVTALTREQGIARMREIFGVPHPAQPAS